MAIPPTQPTSEPSTSASTSSASASAAVFARLHPTQYLSRFLSRGYRPDGRELNQWRDVTINTGSISTADGSSLVRMGDTTIVCGIKGEICEPDVGRPDEGFVVPNIDLPAICSPKFKPGPPSDEAQVLSNWLNDILVSSRTLDPKHLIISPGKAAWAIYIDLVCINYDGNAFDAAVLATMAALRNTKLPRATFNPDTNRTTCLRSERYPLPLGRMPLSCTFGMFESTYLLPDPTSFETPLSPTTLTIALDEKGVAALVRQEGLGGVVGESGSGVLGRCWGDAEERIGVLRGILEGNEGT